jgi:predicted ATPase
MLLEEPETGVHPGALISLLNVLDSYAIDRQFLLSSHSPVVIGQVKPEELRIVYRRNGQTHVRPLDASELDRAAAFLSQEGTLDEFMLSGAIDES